MVGKQDPLDVDVNDILANNAPFDRVEQATWMFLKAHLLKGYAGMAALAAQIKENNLGISKLTPLSLTWF